MNEKITVKKQLAISLPIAFESLINILMTLVDTLVVSRLGTTALGALGAMTVIIDIMQMSIQTINVSNSTLVAKAIGEKDNEKLKLITGNSILITFAISIITILIIYMIQPIFPALFEVDKICNSYLTVRLIGFIQSSIVTVLSGHQRTIGNQKNILNLRIFAVILNLILDFMAIQLNYGVQGVAWVTVGIDTVLALYLFIKSRNSVKYKFVKKYFDEIRILFKWNFVERIASRVDNFIFNLIVARMGSLEYAVHVILMQIANIYEAFIQGFGDGITISVGIATGDLESKSMDEVKKVARKLINICSIIFPMMIFVIAIIIMKISLKEYALQMIFFKVLPLLLLGTYVTMSATYYFSILRGMRDFKFLAKRNMISSVVKIIVAIILGYTPLGIVGVWMAYFVYGVVQKYLSKKRYEELKVG